MHCNTVLEGLAARACQLLNAKVDTPDVHLHLPCGVQEAGEVEQEVTDLVQLLTSRQAELASMLNGFPQLRSTIWFSEASQQAAVQSLTPQMTENRGKASLWLLFFPAETTFSLYHGHASARALS